MEISIEQLELSNIFISGIQFPEIDKGVTMFMLCYDSPICVTKLSLLHSNKNIFYVDTHDYTYSCEIDDNELSKKHFINMRYGHDEKKYLSNKDYYYDHDSEYLLNKIRLQIPNYHMKIKNPEFNKNIMLPNGQYINFCLKEINNIFSVTFGNIYLDSDNDTNTITFYVDRNHFAKMTNEFWIAFHKPSMIKNARNG